MDHCDRIFLLLALMHSKGPGCRSDWASTPYPTHLGPAAEGGIFLAQVQGVTPPWGCRYLKYFFCLSDTCVPLVALLAILIFFPLAARSQACQQSQLLPGGLSALPCLKPQIPQSKLGSCVPVWSCLAAFHIVVGEMLTIHGFTSPYRAKSLK